MTSVIARTHAPASFTAEPNGGGDDQQPVRDEAWGILRRQNTTAGG